MGKYEKLLDDILYNNKTKNIRFNDLRVLLERLGFNYKNTNGVHFIYSMQGIVEIIDIQPDKRDSKNAKEYQVRQIKKYIEKYKLGGGKDGE